MNMAFDTASRCAPARSALRAPQHVGSSLQGGKPADLTDCQVCVAKHNLKLASAAALRCLTAERS